MFCILFKKLIRYSHAVVIKEQQPVAIGMIEKQVAYPGTPHILAQHHIFGMLFNVSVQLNKLAVRAVVDTYNFNFDIGTFGSLPQDFNQRTHVVVVYGYADGNHSWLFVFQFVYLSFAKPVLHLLFCLRFYLWSDMQRY